MLSASGGSASPGKTFLLHTTRDTETILNQVQDRVTSSLKQQTKVFFKNIELLSEWGFGEI